MRAGWAWEYVHICIDDHSRIAVTDIHPDEKATSAIACLKASVACYLSLGITVARAVTDNGSCCKAKTFAAACKELNLKHIRTDPTPPRPTARPKGSFRPPCENGPAPAPAKPRTSESDTCQNGPACPIGTGLMAV